ncbi:hypothetical protein CDD83_5092 [Cordyceps sp. RAO-2017]|nr:hypothetical protein CDD83_5092 [Cordyceps sp. RAO-2017]
MLAIISRKPIRQRGPSRRTLCERVPVPRDWLPFLGQQRERVAVRQPGRLLPCAAARIGAVSSRPFSAETAGDGCLGRRALSGASAIGRCTRRGEREGEEGFALEGEQQQRGDRIKRADRDSRSRGRREIEDGIRARCRTVAAVPSDLAGAIGRPVVAVEPSAGERLTLTSAGQSRCHWPLGSSAGGPFQTRRDEDEGGSAR